MLGLRKRAKFIASGTAQVSYLMRNGTQLRGLDTARDQAASVLAGGASSAQPKGQMKAGGASHAILKWSAGDGGPLFLEKITDNQFEFDLCKSIAGQQILHGPKVLGAVSYRTRFHIFLELVQGTPQPFHSPEYPIFELVKVSHQFGISISNAAPETYKPRQQCYRYLTSPWARKELLSRHVDLAELDKALSETQSLPQHLHHNDLFYENALLDAGAITLIDYGNVTRTHLGGELRHLAFNGVKDPAKMHLFETSVGHLSALTQQSAKALRTSALIQSAERMIERSINKVSPKFLDHSAAQIRAI